MKAYVLHGVGDLRYEDVPKPEISPGWALVRVLAAGICSSDIPRVFVKGTYCFPVIPGHEFCGLVDSVADEGDSIWIGKRVGVYPLIPCKRCPSCAKGIYETCSHYDYIGSRRDGAFAEYVAVPVWNLIELPRLVSDIEGALLEPASVALHAVKRLGELSGKRVCVVGTGPIGMLAGQWARLRGARRMYIKGRGEGKREFVQSCGLDYISEVQSDEFDCVIEAVGTNQALEESLELARPCGTIVLMGNPDGDRRLTQKQYWSILRKQLTVTGTWNSSYKIPGNDWSETAAAMENGALRVNTVVSHVLKKERLYEGLEIMREKREPYAKIIGWT